jgi:hypothetical protein
MNYDPNVRLSIVAYKPKPGKEAELMALAHEHVPYLRSIGLATGRPTVIATAADGTVVEVFEWELGGIEKAHTHPGVLEMWGRFGQVCDYVPLNTLAEAGMMFASFIPIN